MYILFLTYFYLSLHSKIYFPLFYCSHSNNIANLLCLIVDYIISLWAFPFKQTLENYCSSTGLPIGQVANFARLIPRQTEFITYQPTLEKRASLSIPSNVSDEPCPFCSTPRATKNLLDRLINLIDLVPSCLLESSPPRPGPPIFFENLLFDAMPDSAPLPQTPPSLDAPLKSD